MLKLVLNFFLLSVAIGVNCQTEETVIPTLPPSTTRAPREIITVTNGGTEGEWGPLEHCPSGSRVVSYQTRNELATPRFDDTALNTIVLFCNDQSVTNLTSSVRFSGDYHAVQTCPFGGYMKSFQLRVSPNGTEADNTAANDIRFRCSNGGEINGLGNTHGDWGQYSEECANGLCGIETRVQPYDGGIGHYDNTALNDVRFTCCK
ncbi:vitelline membrane outer layer protein 1 homolog [Daphnia carinata]|uniref:vitelline membrane outer layer protein 1 homolog n=1 Tax=Daphnia carinata TaxID=120202 RepID=UPI0025794A15|nr:vitelline membrane outer layer protein 1 homolog [Daphnia carinata]